MPGAGTTPTPAMSPMTTCGTSSPRTTGSPSSAARSLTGRRRGLLLCRGDAPAACCTYGPARALLAGGGLLRLGRGALLLCRARRDRPGLRLHADGGDPPPPEGGRLLLLLRAGPEGKRARPPVLRRHGSPGTALTRTSPFPTYGPVDLRYPGRSRPGPPCGVLPNPNLIFRRHRKQALILKRFIDDSSWKLLRRAYRPPLYSSKNIRKRGAEHGKKRSTGRKRRALEEYYYNCKLETPEEVAKLFGSHQIHLDPSPGRIGL